MLKHWPQGLKIGLPISMVFFFPALGPILSSAFISNVGQIEEIFHSL